MLRKKLAARGPSGTLRAQLQRLAEEHADTRSAIAAARLAEVAAGDPDAVFRR